MGTMATRPLTEGSTKGNSKPPNNNVTQQLPPPPPPKPKNHTDKKIN